MVRVAYQGIEGSYSEQATMMIFPEKDTSVISCCDFEKVFVSLVGGEVDYAVIPVENSLGGSIHLNYDLLEEHAVYIIKEYNLRIQHCLLGTPGSNLETFRTVCSHPQALHQCRHHISKLGYSPIPACDTAGSAKAISESDDITRGAIASERAGRLYGLEIIQKNLEDNGKNYTRFLVIQKTDTNSKPPLVLSGDHWLTHRLCDNTSNVVGSNTCTLKTSIVIGFNNSVGALHKVLTYFSLQGIDLTKIESRPNVTSTELECGGDNPFQYRFYLDFVSDEDDKAQILQNLSRVVSQLKVLGSYPVDSEIHSSYDLKVSCLRIGIIGFGRFGQFVAKYFSQSHQILVTSRGDYSKLASESGYSYYPTMSELIEAGVDCVMICVSIGSFQTVVRKLVKTTKLSNELIVDVLSVKEWPYQVLQDELPTSCDILLTHPMFGPDSCPTGDWTGQPLVYYPVRIHDQERASHLLESLKPCRLIQLQPSKHDQITAGSQCLSHFLGRSLAEYGIQPSIIDTLSYESLCQLSKVTENDSPDLFQGLIQYNKYSSEVLQNFMESTHRVLTGLINIVTDEQSDT